MLFGMFVCFLVMICSVFFDDECVWMISGFIVVVVVWMCV